MALLCSFSFHTSSICIALRWLETAYSNRITHFALNPVWATTNGFVRTSSLLSGSRFNSGSQRACKPSAQKARHTSTTALFMAQLTFKQAFSHEINSCSYERWSWAPNSNRTRRRQTRIERLQTVWRIQNPKHLSQVQKDRNWVQWCCQNHGQESNQTKRWLSQIRCEDVLQETDGSVKNQFQQSSGIRVHHNKSITTS